jgi:predicted FMN-binding regulatory protein PaiB
MVTAIVGFRLKIMRLEGIRKLSQNSRAEDRNGVTQALAASTHPREQVLRNEMLRNN